MSHAAPIEALVDNCFHSFHGMQSRLYELLDNKKILTDEERCLALAVEFVDNEFKHNPELIGLTHIQQGGFSFSITFPLVIPMTAVYWKKAEYVTDKKDRFDAYQSLFAGKFVKQTIMDVYNFIDKYFKIVIDNE